MNARNSNIPIIDVLPLVLGRGDRAAVASQIGLACREHGFFYITGHAVDESLQRRLEDLSRDFFAQPLEEKLKLRMELGGRAWRGYFPVGGELTSGKPDLKEGLYFGAELGAEHPCVRAGAPLHGANLFPESPAELRDAVLDYMQALTQLGHQLMAGISLSLGLDENYFADHYTDDPLTLFRIFNYPAPGKTVSESRWGVGEHTDYGLLTILKQDEIGGLQIKTKAGWMDAPPIAGAFVCNIGDMLERLTRGIYLSTPHRVRNAAGRDRLSFPFFFDPNFNSEIKPIPLSRESEPQNNDRWDGASVHDFSGAYGDYIMSKVARVFPDLRQKVV